MLKTYMRYLVLFIVIGVIWEPRVSIAMTPKKYSIDLNMLDSFIKDQMQEGDIPGLAVVLVKNDQVIYKKTFGYADVAKQIPVTPKTLFELGSTSKAFTGLAILQLEQEGYLSLKDPVSKYLPWFYMNYKGEKYPLTIEDFLYHRTGIPFSSIGYIPESTSDNSLEETVRSLVGIELNDRKNAYPSEFFQYASINYDVLGLIIQQVTGQKYEKYMQNHIFTELGMNQSYLLREEAFKQTEMAIGYKRGFLAPRPYKAPTYRGNTPAGYVISNANDISRWMLTQIGSNTYSQISQNLIDELHRPDRSVSPSETGASYAAGWFVYQKGSGELSHSGENPNFSSYFVFRPSEKIGVAVLTNINSSYTSQIGQGIMDKIIGVTPTTDKKDSYTSVDQIATFLILILTSIIFIILYLLRKIIIQIFTKKRKFCKFKTKQMLSLITSFCLLCLFFLSVKYLPNLIFQKLPWNAVVVWAPFTVTYALILALTVSVLYFVYHVLNLIFPMMREKPYLTVISLSIISGFGNAFIIFIINQSLGHMDNYKNDLLFYFGLGVLMYIYSQKIVRKRLIIIANRLVYSKRQELIDRLLQTPFYRIEAIEDGKIQTVLNKDTETISSAINLVVSSITHIVTLFFCFLYLGFLNFYGLLISILLISCAITLYVLVGKRANKVWEETRTLQNVFFRRIEDLIGGFKELRLNSIKSRDFQRDILENCKVYSDKNIGANIQFANVFVIGELVFTLVIGGIAFLFPVIFPKTNDQTIRSYIFVLLYMTGPINGILSAIPQLIQVKISWGRINQLLAEVFSFKMPLEKKDTTSKQPVRELQVNGVTYSYKNTDGKMFSVGPIDYTFRSGEITFITGGNGSGKSTLAKLITGLYEPDNGIISINDEIVTTDQLSEYYSAIFSDFYLFDYLYGINLDDRQEFINQFLYTLQLEQKVEIISGRFSTTKLSTGQKKRLALLISYLEDKPILLFDEWAADQDPEFRQFFYEHLLPELSRGVNAKIVIAITHDDSYFHVADKLIKLELGKIVKN